MDAAIQPQPDRLSPFVRVTMRIWVKSALSVVAAARPIFDLLVRIELAQTMLRAAMAMMFGPSLPHAFALMIGLAAPFALMAGLGTRMSALALGGLILAGWRSPLVGPVDLILLALLGWYVVRGAGALSVDHLIAEGLSGSALPLAAPVMRVLRFASQSFASVWLLVLRLWLAVTLLVAAGGAPRELSALLPTGLYGLVVPASALPLAILLAIGLATPLVILLVFLGLGTAMLMDGHVGLLFLPTLLLGLIALYGAGSFSLDMLVRGWLERNVLFDRRFEDVPAHWPHVVVVGAGFGGLAAVALLKRLPVRITLIDRHNYHLFQPLLYQIATANLSPADVATPIRSLFARDGNVRVLLGTVTAIDRSARRVEFSGGHLDYQTLVIATGATHSYFGHDEWAPFAPGLKTIEDGIAVRAAVLRAFERAEASTDPEHVARLLTFVIVGAGPTGVELAGAIAELAHHGLAQEYRTIDPASARIVLVQSGSRILPAFPPGLSQCAMASLEELGVEILLDSRVTGIDALSVKIGDHSIATETVLWGAGVMASPAGHWLGCASDSSGRVKVDAQLRVLGCDHVFAIGDTASSAAWEGKPVPGLAPAAKQAGAYVARMVEQDLLGKPLCEPFRYKHQGSMATIGRKSAVADFGRVHLSGALAWWLWGAVHVGFLAGARNRVAVLVNWGWSYFTMRPGIRLITDRGEANNS